MTEEFEKIILNKIGSAIRTEFTKEEIKTLYKDQTPQNFTKPCIVILEYDTQEEHLGNSMARYYVYFDIILHIEFDSSNLTGIYTYMRNYAGRLSRILDYLSFTADETGNRAIRLKKNGWRTFVQDGIGHCMVEYHYLASTKSGQAITPITQVNGTFNYEKER